MHQSEIVLSTGVSLLGCDANPLGGFGVVLRNAVAVVVHHSEHSLSLGVPLFSGEAIPLGGFDGILGNVFARVIQPPKYGLSYSRPPLGIKDKADNPFG